MRPSLWPPTHLSSRDVTHVTHPGGVSPHLASPRLASPDCACSRLAVAMSDVIGAAAESGAIDAGMEARLAEHLPTSAQGESVQGSLVTPQVQQVWPLLAWHARARP